MERFYNIAGMVCRVIIPDGWSYGDDGVLAEYQTDGTRWDRTLEVEIVDQLPKPEGEQVYADPGKRVYISGDIQLHYEGAVENSLSGAYMCIRRQGTHSLLQVLHRVIKDRITHKIILNAIEAEHQIVQCRGFLLHASCIRWKNQAILFTAPSGTGKSTQADLWCRLRGAELINGDRAAVCVDTVSGMPMVHGIPYAGSSGVCKNTTLPLAAIVYLSQAPFTAIEPLTGFRAFRNIWEGCSINIWNREDVQACSQTVMDVLQQVPVFHLACTPDESAVVMLEHELEMRR